MSGFASTFAYARYTIGASSLTYRNVKETHVSLLPTRTSVVIEFDRRFDNYWSACTRDLTLP